MNKTQTVSEQQLRAALEPFTTFNSSEETITITVRTEDIRRARALLAAPEGQDAEEAARWREVERRFDDNKESACQNILWGLLIEADPVLPFAEIIDAEIRKRKP